MLVNVPKGKYNSRKILKRYILKGSNGSKKQEKAEQKMEARLPCDCVVPWDEASALLDVRVLQDGEESLTPKHL